jgi:putative flippase GtrA
VAPGLEAATEPGAGLAQQLVDRHAFGTHAVPSTHTARGYGVSVDHATEQPLGRLAFSATAHCLTGCAIGEVLGMVLSTWWGWGDAASIALAIVLAFFFGYLLTSLPLLRSGMSVRRVAPLAFASDTASIATMEVVDNLFILIVPGAIAAGLGDPLFWWSLGVGLLIAGVVAYPINRWLIARGRGHAVVHAHHAG